MKLSAPFLALGTFAVLALCGCPNSNPTTCSFDSDCNSDSKRCCSGQCRDLTNDVDNCGACGAVCPAVNGTASCVARACRIACDEGRGNCDNVITNGCETDLEADKENCGQCGKACFATNAAGVCTNGVCGKGACDPGYADCDTLGKNGCEVQIQDDLENCGACGNVCEIAHASPRCFAGSCAVQSCDEGHADCDLAAANGCEINLQSDPLNCGACAVACEDDKVCLGGECKRSSLILFGGAEDPELGFPVESLVRFDLKTRVYEPLAAVDGPDGAPQGRAAHLAVWDGAAKRMVIFGGVPTTFWDEAVWALDFSQEPPMWQLLPKSAASPGPRNGMCYAFDRAHRTIYMFGGRDDSGTNRNDFWKLDLATGEWTQLHADLGGPEDPPAIDGSSCAFADETSTFVMFGGADATTVSDALWTWDTTAETPAWNKVTAQNALEVRTNAVFFDGASPLALFGGATVNGLGNFVLLNDVQTLDLGVAPPTWTEETASGTAGQPPHRFWHAGTYAHGQRFVFGGLVAENGAAVAVDDLWGFDPDTQKWTELAPPGAPGAPAGKYAATVVLAEE